MDASTSRKKEAPVGVPSLPQRFLKYYVFWRELNDEQVLVRCKDCGRNIKFTKKATSSLTSHMQRRHPVKYNKYMREKKLSTLAGSSVGKGSKQQQPSDEKKRKEGMFKDTDAKQKALTEKLFYSIVCDQLPINIVESSTFCDFVREAEPGFKIPSSATIKETLPQYCAKMEAVMKEEFRDLSRIYLTLDLWTNRRKMSFFGATVHFINKSWELKSRILACEVLENGYKDVSTAYQNLVDRYAIRGKVEKVVANSPASLMKAFEVSLPGFIDEGTTSSRQYETDLIEEEINFENIFTSMPERMPCFADSLQLCVKDGLTHQRVKNSPLAKILEKTSRLVCFPSVKSILSEDTCLQFPHVMKWLSQLKTIKSLLKNEDRVNNAIAMENDINMLSQSDISALKEILKVLDPFREAMESEAEQVTISTVGPNIVGLTLSLEASLKSQLSFCRPLASVLLESVNKRLAPIIPSVPTVLPSYLDPRFKLKWLPSELPVNDEIHNVVKDIISAPEFQSLIRDKRVETECHDQEKEHEATGLTMSAKKPRLLSYMLEPKDKQKARSHTYELDQLLKDYVSEECIPLDADPLIYWKERPSKMYKLQQLAREFLSCTAVSAPAQRVFNVAGDFFTPSKTPLGVATCQELMFINVNKDICLQL